MKTSRICLTLALTLSVLAGASVEAAALQPLTYGGEGELYAPFPTENPTIDGNRMRIRSVELTAQSSFDDVLPGLHGKLTAGADDVAGDLVFNIREGYVVASDLGVDGLDFRAGKFYLPIGLLNQERRSSWNFPSAPRAIALFFTDNGLVDTGLDLLYHTGRFQIRAGASNGYRFDSSIQNGGTRPLTPTHFVRPEVVFHLGESDLSIAGNYLSRIDNQGEILRISGVDVSLTPAKDDSASWRGQMELFHRYQNPQQGLALVEDVGGYIFAGKKCAQKLSGGVRLDVYKIPSLTDQSGANRKNLTLALTPVVTYEPRGHARLQGSYTYLKETRDGNTDRAEQMFEIRFIAEFGDIPKFRTPEPGRSSL
jgi:hypothetical protein